MSQLAIYVLIFVLLGLYVPLIQLYSVQKRDMNNRRLRSDKRSIIHQQKDLFNAMSLGQKILIFCAAFAAAAAIMIYFSWDYLVALF